MLDVKNLNDEYIISKKEEIEEALKKLINQNNLEEKAQDELDLKYEKYKILIELLENDIKKIEESLAICETNENYEQNINIKEVLKRNNHTNLFESMKKEKNERIELLKKQILIRKKLLYVKHEHEKDLKVEIDECNAKECENVINYEHFIEAYENACNERIEQNNKLEAYNENLLHKRKDYIMCLHQRIFQFDEFIDSLNLLKCKFEEFLKKVEGNGYETIETTNEFEKYKSLKKDIEEKYEEDKDNSHFKKLIYNLNIHERNMENLYKQQRIRRSDMKNVEVIIKEIECFKKEFEEEYTQYYKEISEIENEIENFYEQERIKMAIFEKTCLNEYYIRNTKLLEIEQELENKKQNEKYKKEKLKMDQELIELENEYLVLRKNIRCTSCDKRYKNTLLMKCKHVFCKDCLDERLRTRMRTCPICGESFHIQDFKNVILI